MSSNYFLIAVIPLVVTSIIIRVYTLRHLDQPADYSNAPWYVRLVFNGGWVRLIELRKTALIHLIGVMLFGLILMLGLTFKQTFGGFLALFLFFFFSFRWMDKNQAWGTEKPESNIINISTFSLMKKDGFIIFQLIALLLICFLLSYTQLDEYVWNKGYEAGVKEGKEQLRQDSLRSHENK
jgi:hypothetical protein